MSLQKLPYLENSTGSDSSSALTGGHSLCTFYSLKLTSETKDSKKSHVISLEVFGCCRLDILTYLENITAHDCIFDRYQKPMPAMRDTSVRNPKPNTATLVLQRAWDLKSGSLQF